MIIYFDHRSGDLMENAAMNDKLLMCHLIRVIIYLIDIKKLGHHLYAQKKKKKLPHQHFKILI